MLATNSAQLSQSAAIPGAVVEPTRVIHQGPPAVTTFPRELGERLGRMEQALEATALEVERIGEGQRFLTRLFTEGEGARAIGSGASGGTRLLERKQGTPDRVPGSPE